MQRFQMEQRMRNQCRQAHKVLALVCWVLSSKSTSVLFFLLQIIVGRAHDLLIALISSSYLCNLSFFSYEELCDIYKDIR